MNYLEIVLLGYFDKNNREYLEKYFFREFKKAEKEYYDSDEFFGGCISIIDSWEKYLKDKVFKRKSELYLMLNGAKNGTLKYADQEGGTIEQKRQETIGVCEKEIAEISEVNYYVHLHSLTNGRVAYNMSYSELLNIKQAILSAYKKAESKDNGQYVDVEAEIQNKKALQATKLNASKEESYESLSDLFALHDFLSVPAPDILHKGAFWHDENDKPIDCNIYHPKYGYKGMKTYSNDVIAASFNTRFSYKDYDSGETIYAPYHLQMLCSADGMNFVNKDGKRVLKVDWVQSNLKRLAENDDDFGIIYQRELSAKGLKNSVETKQVFDVELTNHVQSLIELHKSKSTYTKGLDIELLTLAQGFLSYLKESENATHREVIIADIFKTRAGLVVEKTPATWKAERGEKARQAYYTTLKQSDNYKAPTQKELKKVIQLLREFPQAQKMASNELEAMQSL